MAADRPGIGGRIRRLVKTRKERGKSTAAPAPQSAMRTTPVVAPVKASAAKSTAAKATVAKVTPAKPAAQKSATKKATATKTGPAKSAAAKGEAKRAAGKTVPKAAASKTAPAKASKAPAKAPAKTPAKGSAKSAAKAPAKVPTTPPTPSVKAATKAPGKKISAPPTKATKAAPAKAVPAKAAAPAKAPPAKAAPARKASGPPVLEGESPWTKAELAEIRTELEAQDRELRGEINEAESAWQSLQRDSGEGAGDDQADAGTKTFEREHELSIAANSRDLLSQVERALQRLDNGTYGTCENCGNPIGKARLQAFPRATLCVTCKQREERR